VRRQLVIAFLFASLVAVSAGCGGGGSDDGDSANLTPKAFVAQADEICTKSENRIAAEFKAFQKKQTEESDGKGKGESPEEVKTRTHEAIEAVGIPQLHRLLDELRELEAPASKEADMTAYLDALEEEIEAGEDDPQTLNGSPEKIFAKSEAAAKGLGFKVCANKNP